MEICTCSILRAVVCLSAAILLGAAPALRAVEVEADGRAAGDQPNAREQALADALREAVRMGVGEDVRSSTGVKDFALDFDRILSSAFGHVKTHRVLSSGLAKDGFYHVKVKADVEKGTPAAGNILALRQLVQIKGAPRVAIAVQDHIHGIAGSTSTADPTHYAQAILEKVARDLQISLVDTGTAHASENRMAARDEILGNERAARLRSAGVTQQSDFLIEGNVTVHSMGRQSAGPGDLQAPYKSDPTHVFSVGGELKVLVPDTGELVVSVVLQGNESIESELVSAEMAARDVIQKVLSGAREKGQSPLFSKLLARWVADNDLGSVKRLEFEAITSPQYQHLRGLLGVAEKVSAVWPRQFDAQGLSVIDVETRLDAGALGVLLGEMSRGQISVSRATQHLVSCRVLAPVASEAVPPEASAVPPATGTPAPQSAVVAPRKWWWPF